MLSFKSIWGHERVVGYLQRAVVARRWGHATVFCGQDGLGKMTLARTFAKTILCGSGESEPCGGCSSCVRFESGNHPDMFYVTPGKTKSIGVDDIREQVSQNMMIKPYEYPYKVFIVAGPISTAAQNALLKTIEEPSSFGVFIILTQHIGMLLPTVRSRCVVFELRPLPTPLVEDYLVNKAGASVEEAKLYARYGNIGKALTLKEDDNFKQMQKHVLELFAPSYLADEIQAFKYAKELENYKENIQDVLDVLYFKYRDLLVQKAQGLTLTELFKRLDAILETKRLLHYNANFLLALEVMLLKFISEGRSQ